MEDMRVKLLHHNHFVYDLEKNMKFYEEALGLVVQRRMDLDDGNRIIVFMGNDNSEMQVVLTWRADRKEPYKHGVNKSHIAVHVANVEEAYKRHKAMGITASELLNKLYFITDPEGYRLEILDESL